MTGFSYEKQIPLLPQITDLIAGFCSRASIGLGQDGELRWVLSLHGRDNPRVGIFIDTSNSVDIHFVYYGEGYRNGCPVGLPPIFHIDLGDKGYVVKTLSERLDKIGAKFQQARR